MKRRPNMPSPQPEGSRPRSIADDSKSHSRAGNARSANEAGPSQKRKLVAPTSPAVSPVKATRRSRSDGHRSEKPDIGFKKPPKTHSWKKGQSGNPKGRKRGSRNKKTIIISLMEGRLGRKIPDPRKLTAQEAMLWKAIQKGLAGDAKAMAFAFKRYDDATANSWAGPVFTTEDDRQTYDTLRAKLRSEIEEDNDAAG